MHVTPWRQDVESLDRIGLLQAMPAGDSESDVKDRRWEQRVELMRDAIIYNRNSPSIVFYETGNRGVSEEHMQQMRALRDQYDPRGGRAAGSREMLNTKVAEYGGEMLYIRCSGEVDAMRIAKDGFWAHQVMWDGWVDVEKPRAHIIGHWNYAAATVKPVTVVSSAERVELFLNDKSLGFGEQSERFLFTFREVAWQSGTLRAVGYGADGKAVSQASVVTAGAPAALRLSARTAPAGMRADGADLALVEVEVVDAAGRRHPTALDMVDFKVDGPAGPRADAGRSVVQGHAQGGGDCGCQRGQQWAGGGAIVR